MLLTTRTNVAGERDRLDRWSTIFVPMKRRKAHAGNRVQVTSS